MNLLFHEQSQHHADTLVNRPQLSQTLSGRLQPIWCENETTSKLASKQTHVQKVVMHASVGVAQDCPNYHREMNNILALALFTNP